MTKPAPVTPLAPFEVSMATSRMVSSCPQLRSTCSACAMNNVARVHVDIGAIEVERIAGRHHKADDLFRTAKPLEFRHQERQGTFGGRRSKHDQKLVLDVTQEADDREAERPRDRTQHDQNEDRRGRIEGEDEVEEVSERARPIFADREGHGAERAERRDLHDDADDGEHRMGEIVHETSDSLRALAQIEERKAEQDGEEQHLEDVADLEDPRRSCLAEACVGATDEGADDAVGNDVQDEVDRPNLPGRVRIALGLRGLLRCERDVRKACAGRQTLPTVRPTTSARVETASK